MPANIIVKDMLVPLVIPLTTIFFNSLRLLKRQLPIQITILQLYNFKWLYK
jgi:hypothetical protein